MTPSRAVIPAAARLNTRSRWPRTFDNEYIDGTLVQRSDLRVTVPAASLPFVPAIAASDTQDAIEIDGTIYSVIAVSPAYAGESVATYELQVRG